MSDLAPEEKAMLRSMARENVLAMLSEGYSLLDTKLMCIIAFVRAMRDEPHPTVSERDLLLFYQAELDAILAGEAA